MSSSGRGLLLPLLLSALFLLSASLLVVSFNQSKTSPSPLNTPPNLPSPEGRNSHLSPSSEGEVEGVAKEDEVIYADNTITAAPNSDSVLGVSTYAGLNQHYTLTYPSSFVINLKTDGTYFRVQDHGVDVLRVDYDKNVTLLPGSTLHLLGKLKDASGSLGELGQLLTAQGSTGSPLWANQADLIAGDLACEDCLTSKEIGVLSDLSVTGVTTFNSVGYSWPSLDGANQQFLQTNGEGSLAWSTLSGGNLSDFNISSPTSGQILIYDGTDSWDNRSVSGDATLSSSGVLTISCTDCLNATEIEDIYLLNSGDTATGDYNFDSNTLFVDSVNNRVGVGTGVPGAMLDLSGGYFWSDRDKSIQFRDRTFNISRNLARWISSADTLVFGDNDNSGTAPANYEFKVASGAPALYINNSGNIGIGTTDPGVYKLRVVSTTASPLLLQAGNSGSIEIWKDATPSKALGIGLNVPGGTLGNDMVFSTYDGTSWSERMIILNSTGLVGIGDTTPASLLTVGNGDLFQVNSSGDIVKLKNLTYAWPSAHTTDGVLTNNGTGTLSWSTIGAAGITADSLDFSEFQDQLDLDAATDILVSGSMVLSITNTGSGNSLVVNDAASDTTPFVIDASGNVGVGITAPGAKLSVSGSLSVSGDNDGSPLVNFHDSNTVRIPLSLGSGDTSGFGADTYSATLRFNGAGVAWGDFAYFPTGGDNAEQGHYRFMRSAGSPGSTPDAKVGVGSLYAASNIGIGTASPGSKLHIVDSVTTSRGTMRLGLEGVNNQKEWLLKQGAFSDGGFGILAADGSADAIAITNDGKVTIGGSTTPTNRLNVKGAAVVGGNYTVSSFIAPSNGLLVEGSVGIGTTSPQTKLQITSDSTTDFATDISLTPSAADALYLLNDTAGASDYTAIALAASNGGNGLSAGRIALVKGDGSGFQSTLSFQLRYLSNSSTKEVMRLIAPANGDAETGYVGINKTTPGAKLHITTSLATTKGLIVQGAASQTANLQEWQDSSATVLASVNSVGNLSSPVVLANLLQLSQQGGGTEKILVNANGITWGIRQGVRGMILHSASTLNDPFIQFEIANTYSGGWDANKRFSAIFGETVVTGGAATIGLIVQGATSQSANLQEWQNSSGTVLASVDDSGQIVASTDGLVTKVISGACDDSAFTTDTDGLICLDSSNGRIYFRYGGAWHYSAQTAGFQIPNLVWKGVNETEGLKVGDYVVGKLDQKLSDGALHGIYVNLNEVLDERIKEALKKLTPPNLPSPEGRNQTLSPSSEGELEGVITLTSLVVKEALSVHGNLNILGTLSFSNPDSGGRFTIPEGKTTAKITFSTPYSRTPNIHLTPVSHSKQFLISHLSPAGFTVELTDAAGPATFSWLAILTNNKNPVKAEFSGELTSPPYEGGVDSASAEDGVVITPEPTPEPPISSPLPSASSAPESSPLPSEA
jgi:hypothetical protein